MGQDKIICMAPYRPKTTKADIKSWNPGVTPLYKPYSYMPPYRVGFLRRFGLKTGIHFAHFGLESGMVFEGTTGVYERIYHFNSKWVRKKENMASKFAL